MTLTAHRLKTLCLAGLALIAAIGVKAGTVTVSVSPNPAYVGQDAQLVLTYRGRSYPSIMELPDIAGITWRRGSSSKSLKQMGSTVICQAAYAFAVGKPGDYTIPPLKVAVDGKKVLTDAVKFKAVEHKFVTRDADDGKKRELTINDLMYTKVLLPAGRKTYYVGEEIPVEVQLYGLKQLQVEPREFPRLELEDVVFRDFTSVNRNANYRDFTTYQQDSTTRDGMPFHVYTTRTSFRFLKPGEFPLKLELNCVYVPPQQRRNSFFDSFQRSQSFTTRADAGTLKVLPLPSQNDNSKFLGLVGDWEVKVKLAGKQKVGEMMSLTLGIVGKGTIETLRTPELKLPGFRLFPPEVDKQASPYGDSDRAEIRYVLIPLQQGQNKLAFEVSTFSTKDGKYIPVSYSKVLSVAPGEVSAGGAVQDAGDDDDTPRLKARKPKGPSGILYLKKRNMGRVTMPLWDNHIILIVCLLILGPVVWAAGELLYRRRQRLLEDPQLRRKLEAQARRGKVLKKLKTTAPEDVDTVIQQDVIPYLNDLLAYPPGTTASELADKVKDRELADCLSHVGHSSFMPGDHMDKTELKGRMIKTLTRFAAVLVFLCLPLLGNAADTGDAQAAPKVAEKSLQIKTAVKEATNLDEALIAYDRGDFTDALNYFRKQFNPEHPDPSVLYNMGNCYYQSGQHSRALVCFERARRLAPWDRDIFENMNFVRRKLFLPQVGRTEHPLHLLVNFRDTFRPDQWMVLAACGWLAVGIAMVCRRYVRGVTWIVVLVIGVLIISAGCLAAWTQEMTTYNTETAIIVGRNVPVYSLPSEDADANGLRLKDGEEIHIEEQRQDWVRIRADEAEGWIHRKDFARLWGDLREL